MTISHAPALPHPDHASRAATFACPECGGEDVARSRTRGVWEHFLKHAVRIRPYRCLDCHTRFFARRRSGLGRPYG